MYAHELRISNWHEFRIRLDQVNNGLVNRLRMLDIMYAMWDVKGADTILSRTPRVRPKRIDDILSDEIDANLMPVEFPMADLNSTMWAPWMVAEQEEGHDLP